MALVEPVATVIDRIGSVRPETKGRSDAVFSDRFMRDHTRFDSFTEFCEQSPWSLHEPGQIRDVDRDQLDEYVSCTTDFETWDEMDTQAAQEDIIERVAP